MKPKVSARLSPVTPDSDDELKFESYYRRDTDRGYEEHIVEIVRHSDGSMFLAGEGDGEFVYLYPDQVGHLKQALKARRPRRRAS